MLSRPGTSATTKLSPAPFTNLLLLFILLFLSPSATQGAPLMEPKKAWGGGEPGLQRIGGGGGRGGGGVILANDQPDVDMLKALEYIESLRQKSAPLTYHHPRHMTDAEKLRAVLSVASHPSPDDAEMEEEEEEEEGRRKEEDKSEELLEAVLSTLRQTEQNSHGFPGAGEGPKRKDYPRVRPKTPRIPLHKKLPLMFEDSEEEEEEGGEGKEEDEEDEKDGRQWKRTKENVEEKYTPQTLATLQSVFDELDQMSRGSKREVEEEEEEEGGDVLKVRNVAYDDGGEDSAPMQEEDEDEREEEEEEEEGKDKQEMDRELDSDDEDREEEEEEDEGYAVKRSKDPDDFADLVDYYLLKVLEKTEEQKPEMEDEEEEEEEEEEGRKQRAARRIVEANRRDDIVLPIIYDFLEISQKYQIPPEDLLDMLLQTGETKKPKSNGANPARNVPFRFAANQILNVPQRGEFRHKSTADDQQRTQEIQEILEILDILGLGAADLQDPVRKQKQQHKSWRSKESTAPTQRRLPDTGKDDYDGTVDTDQLLAYLAAQVPMPHLRTSWYDGRGSRKRDEDDFQHALQDFFDLTESDSGQSNEKEKRQSEESESGGDVQSQDLDNQAVMKLLSFMNPETEESDTHDKRGF